MIKTQHCPNCEATERKLSDFQQKVSDIVKAYTQNLVNYDEDALENLKTLIIPAAKPDPLVEIMEGLDGEWTPEDYTKEIRAALEARGLEIREKNDDQ